LVCINAVCAILNTMLMAELMIL